MIRISLTGFPSVSSSSDNRGFTVNEVMDTLYIEIRNFFLIFPSLYKWKFVIFILKPTISLSNVI